MSKTCLAILSDLTVDVPSISLGTHTFASPSTTHRLSAGQVTIQLPTSIYCTRSADETCRTNNYNVATIKIYTRR